MPALRTMLRHAAQRIGLDVRSIPPPGEISRDIWRDIKTLCPNPTTIFDVGANVGQSVQEFRARFPRAAIHAFEPDRRAAGALARVAASTGAVVHDLAVGDADGETQFYEYRQSVMSSTLQPGADTWSKPIASRSVPCVRLDTFCRNAGIDAIDVLKIDVQGADGAVLRGASGLLAARAVNVIRCELTFSALYQNGDDPLDVLRLARSFGYGVVSFYEMNHRNARLGWLDALLAR